MTAEPVHPVRSCTDARRRSAFTVLELIAALAILGTVVALSVRLSLAVVQQRVDLRTRQAALEVAENVLDEAAQRSSEALADADALAAWQAAAQAALPEGRVELETRDVTEPRAGTRLLVRVTWQDRRGRPVRPVELATFAFTADAGEPTE